MTAMTLSPAPVLPARARHGRRTVRLTRRGRVAVVLTVVALALAVFSLGRVSTTAATDHPRATPLRHVVVEPGENLWAVARAAAPDADPRVTLAKIVDLNGLAGTTVRPGQRLLLPAG